MFRRRLHSIALCVLAGVVGGAAMAAGPAAGAPADTQSAPRIAPDFTLRAAAGENLRLSELRGRVVLLNFWSNACAPCRQILPQLGQWQAQYREAGLAVLAINLDADAQAARATAERLALGYPVLLDQDKTVSRAYALAALPTTVLIDRDGRIRAVATKDGAADAALERQVQELLKE